MQYLYHKEAKQDIIELLDDKHKHIMKVRRQKIGDEIHLRNLSDNVIYKYTILDSSKRASTVKLISSSTLIVKSSKKLRIGWCIIDIKNIEKTLPQLNEMGVESITFIYCARSQHHYKLDMERMNKILLSSSEQCGRSEMMSLNAMNSVKEFVDENSNSFLLNFSENRMDDTMKVESVVIGCEGGLTTAETELFSQSHTIGLSTPMVLRSQSAVLAISSNILL